MSQFTKAAASASGTSAGKSVFASMGIPRHLLEGILLHLSTVADEQEAEYGNMLGAMGMRRTIKSVRQHLESLSEMQLTPEEAHAYSGYSVRHLRRSIQNRGTDRKPVYRLGDLPVLAGHTPRLPADLERDRAITQVTDTAGSHHAHGPEAGPAAMPVAAPSHRDSDRVFRSESRRRGTKSSIEERAIALARAKSPMITARAAAA